MKKPLKMVAGVFGCLVLLLVVFRFTGFGPQGRTPGLWLTGNLVTTPVTDWSLTDKYPTIEIQTRTRYLLPHSVHIRCSTYNGQLYVTSFYRNGTRYPHGRTWNEDIALDPHMRIKIGNRLYECAIVHITDPAPIAAVLQAKPKKYGQPKPKGPVRRGFQVFDVVGNGPPVTATATN
jgi:hypothetical protein